MNTWLKPLAKTGYSRICSSFPLSSFHVATCPFCPWRCEKHSVSSLAVPARKKSGWLCFRWRSYALILLRQRSAAVLREKKAIFAHCQNCLAGPYQLAAQASASLLHNHTSSLRKQVHPSYTTIQARRASKCIPVTQPYKLAAQASASLLHNHTSSPRKQVHPSIGPVGRPLPPLCQHE